MPRAGLGSFGCTDADPGRLASHLGRQALLTGAADGRDGDITPSSHRVAARLVARLVAHRFSRLPFYTATDPHAYQWHVQHHQIIRGAELRQEVQTMSTTAATATSPSPTQRYSTTES